ncbi:MAG: pyridoxine 5'-phosphate synthase [Candidatus Omnitrophica bacterium]|nr:pyridoxine 5'-phosphate synthase [Candidatus Omnitrophota bacterium]MDD5430132.1 pyridoxine 5'-phosphate synthase [Candidatus Omnitrophota bacterium]
MKLGVNVDHTATLRQARGTSYPDPAIAALLAEYSKCDSIVVHVREDRRHIKEKDAVLIKQLIKIPLNLEMSVNKGIVDFALMLKPAQATLVPERRQELTTEGGLDLVKNYKVVLKTTEKLHRAGIRVSLFIDPLESQVKAAKRLKVEAVEFNTGKFSLAKTALSQDKELNKIKKSAILAKDSGLFVAAGHGLDYENVKKALSVKEISELNIGHSIISRAVFVGIASAVREMVSLLGLNR